MRLSADTRRDHATEAQDSHREQHQRDHDLDEREAGRAPRECAAIETMMPPTTSTIMNSINVNPDPVFRVTCPPTERHGFGGRPVLGRPASPEIIGRTRSHGEPLEFPPREGREATGSTPARGDILLDGVLAVEQGGSPIEIDLARPFADDGPQHPPVAVEFEVALAVDQPSPVAMNRQVAVGVEKYSAVIHAPTARGILLCRVVVQVGDPAGGRGHRSLRRPGPCVECRLRHPHDGPGPGVEGSIVAGGRRQSVRVGRSTTRCVTGAPGPGGGARQVFPLRRSRQGVLVAAA